MLDFMLFKPERNILRHSYYGYIYIHITIFVGLSLNEITVVNL